MTLRVQRQRRPATALRVFTRPQSEADISAFALLRIIGSLRSRLRVGMLIPLPAPRLTSAFDP